MAGACLQVQGQPGGQDTVRLGCSLQATQGGCPAVPRGGEAAEPCSGEDRRAGSVMLLLRRLQGPRERPLQCGHPPPMLCARERSVLLPPLSNVSTQRSGPIGMCSFPECFLTPYPVPRKGAPYLAW